MQVEEKIKSLTEALTWETKRREAVERLAVDAFKRRRELEAKLAKNQQAEKALPQEVEASQKQPQVRAGAEQTKLEARTEELQATQTNVMQGVKRLAAAL